eukprot:gene22432-26624_t
MRQAADTLKKDGVYDAFTPHVGDALEKGAKLLCGGRRHALGGTFFEPTILTEAHGEMLIAQEETFGPVA